MNAGTLDGSTTEPGTSPAFTYASGSWVAATGVFTVASGNPSSAGVATGSFAAVFADGSTVTGYVGRITAVSATTITVSLAAKAGAVPADGTGNRTLRVGGAWAGPAGASSFPFTLTTLGSLTDAAADPVRVNLRNDQAYAITAGISLTTGSVATVAGYASAYGDGGRAAIDGGTTGASYVLVAVQATAGPTRLESLELRNNGATGSAAGLTMAGNAAVLHRVVVRDVRGSGLAATGTAATLVECEFYGCNQSNTASLAGVTASGALSLDRCMVHDNAGTNTAGARLTGSAAYAVHGCIFDSNGGAGGLVATGASATALVRACDFHNNGGPGLSLAGLGHVEDSQFAKNATYGVTTGASQAVAVLDCGFATGATWGNGSGATSGTLAIESGTVTYPADTPPWADAANGDFRTTLAAALAAGRGSWLQTQSGYAGTTATPGLGAAPQAAVTVTTTYFAS